MNKSIQSFGVILALLIFGAAVAAPGLVRHQEKEKETETSGPAKAPVSKISPVQAMKIAEKKAGGKAGFATFEFDEGHWIYGVMIAKDGKLFEVEINPISGKVEDSEAATPQGEANEFHDELIKLAKSSL